ncbi:MAG: response regulator [Burkholderiales bacterium]|nr:response regulator [Burkholderiales bacterium]
MNAAKEPTRPQHRLLAILCADGVGYSALMAADDRLALQALDAARARFRASIEAERGRVIDMAGDSVLAAFGSVAAALRAALAVQLAAAASAQAAALRLPFRIGIHLGDVIEKDDGSVYGDGVNIAARLQTLAPPDGVVVSRTVHEAAGGRVAARFTDLGEQAVKNIPGTVRAFAVAAGDSAGQVVPGSTFGRFAVLVAERRLLVDGTPVALGSRAFDLLTALVARRERVVPKEELIEVVWPGLVVEENNLQVQISALRKVLGAQAIATVPGRGYQFTVAPAAAASEKAPATNAPATQAPAVEATMQRTAPPAGTGAAARGSRLLVADDNKVNRLLLCRSLELMGHSVASAENGRAALEKLRHERFDLLLLDLEMPELDGFGLLEQRAADPDLHAVPVIVTSSLEGVAQVARCLELGADDYLHKPVNPVLLKARVESSLERKHLRDRERELLARLAPDLSAGPQAEPGAAPGRRTEATILVARLRDLDALVSQQAAQETLELLSSWTTLMLDAIEGQGGVVSQIAGDGLSAAFDARASSSVPGDAAGAAVRAALEMLELVAQFNAERAALGKPAIALHVGIAGGEVVAGYAGTARRMAYVCVGAAVERAARLEALASGQAGAVLIDSATHAALSGREPTQALPPAVLPGSPDAVPVHALKRTA